MTKVRIIKARAYGRSDGSTVYLAPGEHIVSDEHAAVP